MDRFKLVALTAIPSTKKNAIIASITMLPGDQNHATMRLKSDDAALIKPNIKAFRVIGSGMVRI